MSTPSSKTPLPYEPDAELSVLGALMHGYWPASEGLCFEDFFLPWCAQAFAALTDLHVQGKPTDPVSLAAEMTARGQDPHHLELADAYGEFVSKQEARHHGVLVGETARLRRLASASRQVMDLALARSPEAVTEAERILIGALTMKRGGPRRMNELIDDYLTELQSQTTRGFATGIDKFDSAYGGLMPGRYMIVGARTSFGKSALLAQIALSALRQDRRVLYFTLEMPPPEVVGRLTVLSANVPSPVPGKAVDYDALVRGGSLLSDRDIQIFGGRWDVESMVSQVRIAQAERPVSLVVIDYIQLMGSRRRFNRRDEEVSEVSRSIKQLCNELGIVALVASQFSREHERDKRRPRPSDLRESSSLEQDADLVLLLHQDDDSALVATRSTEFIVAKHRQGPRGVFTLMFNTSQLRFEEL